MIRIVIVDDHPVVRHGLKQIINKALNMEVVGEADDAQKAFTIVHTLNCDLVILDISLPGTSGLDALKQLKYEYPKLPVLILSVHPEDQYAIRVFKAGASGYLMKDSAPETLIKAIKKVVSGGKYVSPFLAEKLAAGLENPDRPLHEKLSNRELQIMYLLAKGTAIKAIAETLHLSPKTVSTYRTRILRKMCMKTNSELTSYTIRNKLME